MIVNYGDILTRKRKYAGIRGKHKVEYVTRFTIDGETYQRLRLTGNREWFSTKKNHLYYRYLWDFVEYKTTRAKRIINEYRNR